MLSRTREITAMRASGLSLRRVTLPLLLLSLVIAIFIFFWNEALVPIFTRESQTIYQIEVRKKQPKSLIGTEELWIRGEDSFLSVDSFNAKKNTLEGVVIYLLDQDFGLRGVVEARLARWDGTRWEARGAKEWIFRPQDRVLHQKAVTTLPLSETPEDLQIFAREPEELGFFDLKKQITNLKDKGIDTSEHEVDLHIKLALPLISPLMVFLAIPFALRQGSRGGIALSFGLTLLIGFGYWVMLAFSTSLGYTATFPPWVAAWLPNATLLLVGLLFSLSLEEA
jgi:lipopolysaccharide export system permease protein